ncbi:alpha-tocopherol transfer protein isoform X2 [Rhipicephalus sanguineus]|uniref:alpha-tocopherol transfer protein isoform X2 n=1 Tax=Rhipicephalus sanguineus TaxID=34632 RepID=UPI001893657B|nr:alpha-tocopherol transfer protein isoform X2 [Rhipicephalus sanguineus]
MGKITEDCYRQLENPGAIKAKPELNLEEIARLELGETPETKAESLLRLRQLLEGAWNPDVCSLVDFTRAFLLLTGSWLQEDHPSICGAVSIMDMKGLNIHHLTHITPSFLVKVAHLTQDCCPVRTKAVYIINHPKIFEVIFSAIKPFLRSKLLSRVHFIGNEALEFWDHIPSDLVPSEYGGSREHFDYARQEQFVRSNRIFFESLCDCGYKDK